jgi:capsular exopolysaccharide synthesis family protein
MTRVVLAQRASVPEYRTSPNKKMNVALGGVIGLIAGFGLALLRERFKKTIGDPADVENVTESRVLGVLPRGGASAASGIVDFDGPSTAVAEAYRCLAAAFADLGDRAPRATVVTGAEANQDKTAAVVNLGCALAETGATVCVVDGDLRTGALSRLYERDGERGLTNVLTSGVGVDDVLHQVGDLTLLSSGPNSSKPSELFGDGFTRVLDDLRTRFDHVIIDTPPLPQFADALLVSRGADGAVIVVRRDRTTRASLSHAVELLNESSTTLFGIVMVTATRRSIFGRRKAKPAKAVRQKASRAHATPELVRTNGKARIDLGGRRPVISAWR